MSTSLSTVNTASDTFGSMVTKLNAIINWANTAAVTANTAGSLTVGNAYVQGSIGSNTVYVNTLAGGNSAAAANIAVSSNTIFQTNVVANTGIAVGNTGISSINAFSYTSSNTSQQALDTFAVAGFRAAKYVISITDPSQPRYQATEIFVMQDGNNAYMTEYATLTSNGSLATFATDINTGNCRLLMTPSVAAVTVKVNRVLNVT